jgi:nucleoside-diphosphate-sugar epimerase
MNRLTIVGGRGFIGSHLVAHAREQGLDVRVARHDAVPDHEPLGVVIYCSGLAWGSDREPLRAFDVHATIVGKILASCTYDRFVYTSSTRVYDRSGAALESVPLSFCTDAGSDVYALSKAAGEAVVLASSNEHRVVRLSNVYGPSFRSELFLSDILRQAAATGKIALRSSLDSAKDYVSINDVVRRILDVATNSNERVYNIASGMNTTHRALLDAIASSLPVTTEIAHDAPTTVALPVNIERLCREFPFTPRRVTDDIPTLVRAFQAAASKA